MEDTIISISEKRKDLSEDEKQILFQFIRKGDEYFELFQKNDNNLQESNQTLRNDFIIKLVFIFNSFFEYGFSTENDFDQNVEKSVFTNFVNLFDGNSENMQNDKNSHFWNDIKVKLKHL